MRKIWDITDRFTNSKTKQCIACGVKSKIFNHTCLQCLNKMQRYHSKHTVGEESNAHTIKLVIEFAHKRISVNHASQSLRTSKETVLAIRKRAIRDGIIKKTKDDINGV